MIMKSSKTHNPTMNGYLTLGITLMIKEFKMICRSPPQTITKSNLKIIK